MNNWNQHIGKKGENFAADYLIHKGYEILEKNWQFGHKEIDIIAKNSNMIVFIEVKTRTNNKYGTALESVTTSKQKFLIEAAENYIDKYHLDYEARFDIIAITTKNNQFYIEHFEEAFHDEID